MTTLKPAIGLCFPQLLSVYPSLLLDASLPFSVPYPCWSRKGSPRFCPPPLPYPYLLQNCLGSGPSPGQRPLLALGPVLLGMWTLADLCPWAWSAPLLPEPTLGLGLVLALALWKLSSVWASWRGPGQLSPSPGEDHALLQGWPSASPEHSAPLWLSPATTTKMSG